MTLKEVSPYQIIVSPIVNTWISECTPTSHHETLLTCYIRQASISYRHRLHLQVHCFSSKMVVSAVCILVAVTAVHLLSACDTGSLRARVLEKVGALVSPPPRLTGNHNRCHLSRSHSGVCTKWWVGLETNVTSFWLPALAPSNEPSKQNGGLVTVSRSKMTDILCRWLSEEIKLEPKLSKCYSLSRHDDSCKPDNIIMKSLAN